MYKELLIKKTKRKMIGKNVINIAKHIPAIIGKRGIFLPMDF